MENEVAFVDENTQGRFRVLNSCISCAACWKLAPDFLTSHPVHAYAYFTNQPQNEEENLLCLQTVKICPVNAIVDSDADPTTT